MTVADVLFPAAGQKRGCKAGGKDRPEVEVGTNLLLNPFAGEEYAEVGQGRTLYLDVELVAVVGLEVQ